MGLFTVSDFSRNTIRDFTHFSPAFDYWGNNPKSFFFEASGFSKDSMNTKDPICDTYGMKEYMNLNGLNQDTMISTTGGLYQDPDSVTIEVKRLRDEFDSVWDNMVDKHKASKLVDSNPKTQVALTKPRLSDVPPVALFALGAAMTDGADKYGRYNWRDTSVTASVFYDAMMRHLSDWYNGEDFADDSKVNHLGHIMASCAILLDGQLHNVFNDDRDNRKPDSISRNKGGWMKLKESYE